MAPTGCRRAPHSRIWNRRAAAVTLLPDTRLTFGEGGDVAGRYPCRRLLCAAVCSRLYRPIVLPAQPPVHLSAVPARARQPCLRVSCRHPWPIARSGIIRLNSFCRAPCLLDPAESRGAMTCLPRALTSIPGTQNSKSVAFATAKRSAVVLLSLSSVHFKFLTRSVHRVAFTLETNIHIQSENEGHRTIAQQEQRSSVIRVWTDGEFFANIYWPFLLYTDDVEYPLALSSGIGGNSLDKMSSSLGPPGVPLTLCITGA